MDWIDKNVMITGASGFIGRALFNELQRRQANVYNYDKKVNLDIRDERQLEDYIVDHEIEIVYHLAAISQVPFANKHPGRAFKTNVTGGINVIDACAKNGVKKLIIASSDKAYGSSPVPYTTESADNAIYPYDVSKMVIDRIADCYAANYSMDIVIARLCNVYGGGDMNFQRLIPSLARDIFRGRTPVRRGHGLMLREWLHITDAVDAYIRLADAPSDVYNFGGEPQTVEQVTMAVQERIKGQPPVELNAARLEIEEQRIDDSKSREKLNWRPWIEFDKGIDLTLDWYRDYFLKAGA